MSPSLYVQFYSYSREISIIKVATAKVAELTMLESFRIVMVVVRF